MFFICFFHLFVKKATQFTNMLYNVVLFALKLRVFVHECGKTKEQKRYKQSASQRNLLLLQANRGPASNRGRVIYVRGVGFAFQPALFAGRGDGSEAGPLPSGCQVRRSLQTVYRLGPTARLTAASQATRQPPTRDRHRLQQLQQGRTWSSSCGYSAFSSGCTRS